MKRPRINKNPTKELITIPQLEKLPEFDPIIDPNRPKIYPNESSVGNPQKESTETQSYGLPKPSEFSVKQ